MLYFLILLILLNRYNRNTRIIGSYAVRADYNKILRRVFDRVIKVLSKVLSKKKEKQNTAAGLRGLKNKINLQFLLMVLPGALLIFVLSYLPMFGIVIAFKNMDYAKGILGSPWVGLKNFEFLFKNPDVWIILRNTIGYNLVFIVLGVVIPVILSIMLSQMTNKRTSKLYQTLVMMPHFISWVVVSYIVFAFLDYRLGFVNNTIIKAVGGEPVEWYSKPSLWPGFIIFLNTWKSFGYGSIVYLAAIAGIDVGLYEAAAIDGANRRQQMWYITLPELLNIIIIMTILNMGKILNADFGLFYNVPMEKGQLMPVTNVINTFVYRALKINNDIGMSSAAGLLQSVVGLVLICAANFIVKRVDAEKSLF